MCIRWGWKTSWSRRQDYFVHLLPKHIRGCESTSPCGSETTRSAGQRKGFRQGPRRLARRCALRGANSRNSRIKDGMLPSRQGSGRLGMENGSAWRPEWIPNVSELDGILCNRTKQASRKCDDVVEAHCRHSRRSTARCCTADS